MPFRKIFRSRWAALLWAGGVVWTAIDTVGFAAPVAQSQAVATSNDADATGVEVNSADLATLANVMKGD